MPFFGLAEPRKYVVAGREPPEPGHEPAAVINGGSPRYFETVGTRAPRSGFLAAWARAVARGAGVRVRFRGACVECVS